MLFTLRLLSRVSGILAVCGGALASEPDQARTVGDYLGYLNKVQEVARHAKGDISLTTYQKQRIESDFIERNRLKKGLIVKGWSCSIVDYVASSNTSQVTCRVEDRIGDSRHFSIYLQFRDGTYVDTIGPLKRGDRLYFDGTLIFASSSSVAPSMEFIARNPRVTLVEDEPDILGPQVLVEDLNMWVATSKIGLRVTRVDDKWSRWNPKDLDGRYFVEGDTIYDGDFGRAKIRAASDLERSLERSGEQKFSVFSKDGSRRSVSLVAESEKTRDRSETDVAKLQMANNPDQIVPTLVRDLGIWVVPSRKGVRVTKVAQGTPLWTVDGRTSGFLEGEEIIKAQEDFVRNADELETVLSRARASKAHVRTYGHRTMLDLRSTRGFKLLVLGASPGQSSPEN